MIPYYPVTQTTVSIPVFEHLHYFPLGSACTLCSNPISAAQIPFRLTVFRLTYFVLCSFNFYGEMSCVSYNAPF